MTSRPHANLTRRLLLVWAVLAVITLAVAAGRLANLELRGDDALRLVQVRDLLAGQGWWDLTQYRYDPPEGVVMHWSRLVDAPIALLLLLLTPLLGQANAELAVLILVPLLTLGVTVALVGKAAAMLFDVRTAGFAALTVGLLTPVLFQLQPTRLDHHGWQVAMCAAGVLGVAMRSPKGAWLAGFALAAGATISLEMLPIAAGFAGYFTLRWLEDGRYRFELSGFLQAFAAGLLVLYGVALGPTFAQYCDAIGPAHLALFAFVALGVTALAARRSLAPVLLVPLLGVTGLGGVGVFGALAPQCLAPPFAGLDPVVRSYWYELIMEGRPAWEQAYDLAIPAVIQLLVGLTGTLFLATRGARGGRRFWWNYGALLAVTLLFGLLTWRSMAFAGIVATVPLGWLVAHVLERLDRASGGFAKAGGLVLLGLALMPSILFAAYERLAPTPQAAIPQAAAPQAPAGTTVLDSECSRPGTIARLASLPPGEMLALFDLAPAILFHTGHSVTAAGYHRGEAAMADAIGAFIADPDEAEALIRARGAAYVVTCADMSETAVYAQANPQGLAARLREGAPVSWLTSAPGFEQGPLKVYRVRPE